jgi:two-component system, NtrC family, response regulator AtoC
MHYTVLVVDDEALTLRTISRGLTGEGFEVLTAESGEEGLRIFNEEKPDLVLLDIVLPKMDGVEVLRQIKETNPASIVVMMSAYHMVDRAVEAMKLGAYDYLIKPFHLADLAATLRRASEMLALRVRLRNTVETKKGQYDFGRVVTKNSAMREMLEVLRKAAETDHTTILIQGESGTGKGVLARAVHYASPRASQVLLELNCATLPDALLESELFGFEPGAFTDARRRKEGLLERAHGGTLFLDEIGNMSASVQAKLLRVLEEGTFMRLGGTRSIKVDVRLVAATNTNLKQAVAEARFREDLFYRLNVVPIFIPPLRERPEDILPIALDLVRWFNHELKKNFLGFTPQAAELLTAYLWPGNIRELKNVIERTMILAPEGNIDVVNLPTEIRKPKNAPITEAVSSASSAKHPLVSLRELEENYIQEVLAATGNNKTQAAKILGIHPTSLMRRLKKEPEPNGDHKVQQQPAECSSAAAK